MKTVFALVLSLLLGNAAPVLADIQVGYETYNGSSYPIRTNRTDSRYQFVIGGEELRISEPQNLHGIFLQLNSASTAVIPRLVIRVLGLTNDGIEDGMENGYFHSSSLTTVSDTEERDLSPYEAGDWVYFGFSTPYEVSQYTNFLLIDLVMDGVETGPTTLWNCSFETTHPVLWTSVGNTNPDYNMLDHESGASTNYRAKTKLKSLTRTLPRIVYSAQGIEDHQGLIYADCEVPGGASCTIRPGVELAFAEQFGLIAQGSLFAEGSEQDSIVLRGEDWSGVFFSNFDSTATLAMDHVRIEGSKMQGLAISQSRAAGMVQLSNLHIRNCRADWGGGLYMYGSSVEMEHVLIEDCTAEYVSGGGYVGYGGGIFADAGTFTSVWTDIQIRNCSATSRGGGIYMKSVGWPDADAFQVNHVLLDGNWSGDRGAAMFINYPDWLQLEHFTILNSSGGAAVETYSGDGPVLFSNCILSNPAASWELRASYCDLVMEYCNLQGLNDNRVLLEHYATFLDLAGNLDHAPDLDLLSYAPLAGSPLIDAGNPSSDNDPDMTRADIGYMYHDQSAPTLTALTDVPEDQGRRLQMVWEAGSMDLAATDPDWSYSMWRLDPSFAERGLQIAVTQNEVLRLIEQDEPFAWNREGDTWSYLGSVPAVQHEEYSQIVESLADFLDGEAHSADYMLAWHDGDRLVESNVLQGTSVDNVPPDAPLALSALPEDENSIRLVWQEVVTGTINGQQLPEQNLLSYRVYEGSTPWFEIEDGTEVGSVTEPHILLPMPQGDGRGFYRVVAEDHSN